MHVDKISSPTRFIQILNVPEIEVQFKTLDLNTLANAYVKSIVFVGTAKDELHKSRRCQRVLGYVKEWF